MIGVRIRAVRLELGMSQRQLAGTEMTRNFISLVEQGRARPSHRALCIIARRLGKPVEFFTDDPLTEPCPADSGERDGLEQARALFEQSEHEAALAALQRLLQAGCNGQTRAEAHGLAARCLAELGRAEEALPQYEASLVYYIGQSDRIGIVRTHLEMGAACFQAEDYGRARAAFETAMQFCAGQKSLVEYGVQAQTYLGTTLVRLGALPAAVAAYHSAWELANLCCPHPVRGAIAMGLGKALFRAGEQQEAVAWTRRAIDHYRRAKSPDQVLAEHNLAAMQISLGQLDDARATLLRCLAAYKLQGSAESQASAMEELANLSLKSANLAQAKTWVKQALEVLEGQNNSMLRGRLYRLMGLILQQMGDSDHAHYFLRMSYDLLRLLKASGEAAASLEALRDLTSATDSERATGP